MDATLFALMRAPAIRNRFWSENPYYREGEVSPGAPSVFERVLKIANAVAYAESRALGHVRATAAGVLLTASSR
jgi:hypothetical protein